MFDAIQDTEAFVTADDKSIMMVFRGTQEPTDWATNLNVIRRRVPEEWGLDGDGCDVHQMKSTRCFPEPETNAAWLLVVVALGYCEHSEECEEGWGSFELKGIAYKLQRFIQNDGQLKVRRAVPYLKNKRTACRSRFQVPVVFRGEYRWVGII